MKTLTVSELITVLQKMNPDLPVIASDGGYLGDNAGVTGVEETLEFGERVVRIET